MINTHRIASRIPLRVVAYALALLSLIGCDAGYNVNRGSNSVGWVTWDEGNGRRERPVEGADAKTFEKLSLSLGDDKPFARDKDHIYLHGIRVEGANPASFKAADQWYRDDKSVFVFVDGKLKQLAESDPNSFRRIDKLFWSRDDTRVFFQDSGFVPDDIASFERLDGEWCKDSKVIYHKSRRLPSIDHDTFVVYEKSPNFARDSQCIYWKGWPVRSANPNKFQPTKHNEGHDDRTNFYFIFKDEESYGIRYRDKETVEIIGSKYSGPEAEESP